MTPRLRRLPAATRPRTGTSRAALWAVLGAMVIGLLVAGPTARGDAVVALDGHGQARAATPSGGWTCTGDLAGSERPPVLLVHGVGLGPEENWSTTLAPFLTSRGHPVCLVALPSYGTRDVQSNVDVVTRAIHGIATAAGRPIDVVGHSLGAYLPRAALRLRPDLAPLVDDVIGMAGVYDLGSRRLVERCAGPCVPALHQLATRSDLLRAVARRRLPAGPSFTNIGSRGDVSVTPQPDANEQPGTTAVLLQDVCARPALQGRDHALVVGDAVAAALLTDALDHPGPTVASRVPAETCDQDWYAGFDPDAFMTIVQRTATRTNNGKVTAEPAVECRLRADCRDLAARGRLLRDPVWQVTDYRVVLRATAAKSGRVRLAVGRNQDQVTVVAGDAVVLSVQRAGRATGAIAATVPTYYSPFVEEQRRALTR